MKCYPAKPTTGFITLASQVGTKARKCQPKFIKKRGKQGEKNMDTTEREEKSNIQLNDDERQPVECWTRQCYGIFSPVFAF